MHIFVEQLSVPAHTVFGEDAHHLVKVRRVHVGEVFPLVETRGSVWAFGRVSSLSKNEVVFTLEKLCEKPDVKHPRIILFPALLKRAAMENVLQRSVELGVDAICPLEASRSVPDARAINGKRWATIVREAAMQSRRFEIPSVSAPRQLNEQLFKGVTAGIVLTTQPTGTDLKTWVDSRREPLESLHVFVGPEGGWTSAEEAFFIKEGWARVSFGSSVLRADTAVLGVLSALRYAYRTV